MKEFISYEVRKLKNNVENELVQKLKDGNIYLRNEDVLANSCKNQFESQKTNSSEEWKVIKRGPSGIYRNEQNDINLINNCL